MESHYFVILPLLSGFGKFLIIALLLILVLIVILTSMSKKTDKKEAEKHLAEAKLIMGDYTDSIVYNGTRVLLADRPSHRLYVNKNVYDYNSFRELITEAKGATTRTVYYEKTEIKTDTGSFIGRTALGALLGGALGAALGASTATQKVVTKPVPKKEYVNASYKIQIMDVNGAEAVFLFFIREGEYKKVLSSLQNLIDENLAQVAD